MKLQFKHQKFQADAAKAVCDVFAGQPYLTPSYMMDRGSGYYQQSITDEEDFTGWSNHKIVPELNDSIILEHIQKIQRANQLAPSPKLEGKYNLTIEMETGVGKTYTYIKTMFELNKHYGWSKFIVVVPSIAIREGVYKSFEVTQEHFAEEYGKKIRFFIYNSSQLTEIDRFASDNSINVMIINSQAFNARGKDARRIYMKLDEFRSRRPIDIIAKTNPIMIIDEPQSVEGKQTRRESPMAITTQAETTGVRNRFQYRALKPTNPSKIPPKMTAPIIPSYPRSGLVQIIRRLPKKVKLTPMTMGSREPIFQTGYNCRQVPIPAANMAHCRSLVISAESRV